jgi:hypothetical protein
MSLQYIPYISVARLRVRSILPRSIADVFVALLWLKCFLSYVDCITTANSSPEYHICSQKR